MRTHDTFSRTRLVKFLEVIGYDYYDLLTLTPGRLVTKDESCELSTYQGSVVVQRNNGITYLYDGELVDQLLAMTTGDNEFTEASAIYYASQVLDAGEDFQYIEFEPVAGGIIVDCDGIKYHLDKSAHPTLKTVVGGEWLAQPALTRCQIEAACKLQTTLRHMGVLSSASA